LIGPEGDFSDNEMNVLRDNNIEIVSLGNRRLRTETAAITALNIIDHGG
jgi:16S rRNA (uracil1498-N3)-methyltransferase